MRFALAAALALIPLPSGAAAARAAVKSDWTHSFGVTADGGFRMGNPKARVAIVEYGSLTCPHCRHFAETAMKPLLDRYVRTGKASYEYRSFVLNGIDLAATLVARCNGPAHFFPMAEQLYATQPAWVGKIANLPASQQDRIKALPQGEMLLALAKAGGLIAVGAAHGIPPARAQTCLKDERAALGLAKMEQEATSRGVSGTPSFFVNGKQVAAFDWATLEPFLKEAGG